MILHIQTTEMLATIYGSHAETRVRIVKDMFGCILYQDPFRYRVYKLNLKKSHKILTKVQFIQNILLHNYLTAIGNVKEMDLKNS